MDWQKRVIDRLRIEAPPLQSQWVEAGFDRPIVDICERLESPFCATASFDSSVEVGLNEFEDANA
jgi:hypothetical protein